MPLEKKPILTLEQLEAEIGLLNSAIKLLLNITKMLCSTMAGRFSGAETLNVSEIRQVLKVRMQEIMEHKNSPRKPIGKD